MHIEKLTYSRYIPDAPFIGLVTIVIGSYIGHVTRSQWKPWSGSVGDRRGLLLICYMNVTDYHRYRQVIFLG